jgi:hypothetical protein
MEGECWFEEQTMVDSAWLDFIVANETIECMGKGVKKAYLI